MKDPHLVDPIYHHYKRQHDEAAQAFEKNEPEIKKLKDLIEKAEPQTGERRALLDMLFEYKKTQQKLTEIQEYTKQKMNDRIKEDQKAYNKAFEEKRPWPNPKDYEAFQVELKLQAMKGKEWLVERRFKELLGKKPSYPAQGSEPPSKLSLPATNGEPIVADPNDTSNGSEGTK